MFSAGRIRIPFWKELVIIICAFKVQCGVSLNYLVSFQDSGMRYRIHSDNINAVLPNMEKRSYKGVFALAFKHQVHLTHLCAQKHPLYYIQSACVESVVYTLQPGTCEAGPSAQIISSSRDLINYLSVSKTRDVAMSKKSCGVMELWSGLSFLLQPYDPIVASINFKQKEQEQNLEQVHKFLNGQICGNGFLRGKRNALFNPYSMTPPRQDFWSPYKRYIRPSMNPYFRSSDYSGDYFPHVLPSPPRTAGGNVLKQLQSDMDNLPASSAEPDVDVVDPEAKKGSMKKLPPGGIDRFCPPFCSGPPTHKLNVTLHIVNKPRKIWYSYH